jgi:uncharacterized protein (DUF2252 family)
MRASASERSVTEEILLANRGRKPMLTQLKFKRLAENAFSFFRGTDHLLVGLWPKLCPPDIGPRLLSCGDLHIENFGVYRTEDGEFLFDVNDFDEALAAPCSIDLVRASASILLGCDAWKIARDRAENDVSIFLQAYCEAVAEACRERRAGRIDPRSGHGPVWDLLGATAGASRTALLDRYTVVKRRGQHRLLALIKGKMFEVSARRRQRVSRAVHRLGKRLGRPDAYRVRDVVGRIAGIGSLGLRRFVVLVEGDGSLDGCWLLDIKEERSPCLLPLEAGSQPDLGRTDAERTAAAQRILQASPAIGLSALKMGGRGYRVRRLVPDENRSSLDHLHQKKKHLADALGTLGQIVAWSHYRGIAYLGENHIPNLADWAAGGAVDAIPEAAARYAEFVHHDYETYCDDYNSGLVERSFRSVRKLH